MDEFNKTVPKKPPFAPVVVIQAVIFFAAFSGSASLGGATFLIAPFLFLLQVQSFLQAQPVSRRFNPFWAVGTLFGLLLGFLKGHDPYFWAIAALYLLPHLFFLAAFLAKTPKSGVVVSSAAGFALSFSVFFLLLAIRNFPLRGEGLEKDMEIVAGMLRSLPLAEEYQKIFELEAFSTLLSRLSQLLPGYLLSLGLWISMFCTETLQAFWIRTGAVRFRTWHLSPHPVSALLAVFVFLAARLPLPDGAAPFQLVAENLDLFFTPLFFFAGVSLFLQRREAAGKPIKKSRVFLIFLVSFFLTGSSTVLSALIRLVMFAASFWGIFHSLATLFRKDKTKNL